MSFFRTATLANLCLRAAGMSILQSAGVVLLARHSWGALATAFLISYFWSSNSRAITAGRSRAEQVAYGVGGALGTAVTLWLA